jgi:hypothetical protein
MARSREEDPAVRGGERGGEAALHSTKVSAAQFAQYMKGIDFPADREKIISVAKANGAPENVMAFMNRLPDRDYNRANEVEEEFGNLKHE